MGYQDCYLSPLWQRYSKKMMRAILTPLYAGYIEPTPLSDHRVLTGKAGSLLEGQLVALYWKVDTSNGILVEARFQSFGHTALLAAAEACCELCVGKNYDQVGRIKSDLIDKHLRDRPDETSFPEGTHLYLDMVLDTMQEMVLQCIDIPLSPTYVTPLPQEAEQGEKGYPGWLELSLSQKLALIETVLDEEIRPYIELDAGGLQVEQLVNDREIIVSYTGACTSCPSSIGATLSSVQHIITTRIHPDLIVVPNLTKLQLFT
jgi:NifU-like protein